MAKEPRDRFRSMDELCARAERLPRPETAASGAADDGRPGARSAAARRPPAGRPSVGPLILLLAGLAVLAGDPRRGVRASPTRRASAPTSSAEEDDADASRAGARFTAATAYDPYGDGTRARRAGAPKRPTATRRPYWTTEHYDGRACGKPGVGLVLDAGAAKQLTQLVVAQRHARLHGRDRVGLVADRPVRVRSRGRRTVGGNTTFTLKGGPAQYYVVWITDLGSNSSVDVNEVTAAAASSAGASGARAARARARPGGRAARRTGCPRPRTASRRRSSR